MFFSQTLARIAIGLTLASTLALPVTAGAAPSANDLADKYEKLQQEMEELKSQMEEFREDTEAELEAMDEKAETWDLASRFQFNGDFRARMDYVSADTPEFYSAMDVATGMAAFYNPANEAFVDTLGEGMGMPPATLFGMIGAMSPVQFVDFMKTFTAEQRVGLFQALNQGLGLNATTPANTYDNDTLWTNRFRMDIRVKALENVEFKGRLSMYKAWGMQNNPVDYSLGGGPFMLNSLSMDGNTSRIPTDSGLYVDRAFVNWNNIGGAPVWFSVGRRPTTDGPPAHFKQGRDKRMATPVAYMDYAFDGISVGYAYRNLFGQQDVPGRVRFCYGRGFESGPEVSDQGIKDTDFAGLSWDVYKKDDRFFNIQSFAAFDMFNVPDDVTFPNPMEIAFGPAAGNGTLDRVNLGNIYHTAAVYTAKASDLNYFVAAGWSRTAPRNVDETGTGLLSSWWDKDYEDAKDGYSAYAGIRYDLADHGLKLGMEYNYGSKNWIAFTPGNDDLYASKLAARGHVGEVYLIWDIPGGEAISKFASAFIRLGYQHYMYDYTGSGFWLGEPQDIDDLKNDPLTAQFYTPIDEMDQVYLTFEATF